MFVKSLKLQNFRNYASLSLEPSPGVNIICGENAQGKTNILEALYLCGTSRSHRGARDRDMIRFGEEEGHIRMHLNRKDNDIRIDMHLRSGRAKGIAVGGVPLKRAGELFEIVHMVFFSPEDLHIIKNGPSERRRFLDFLLCETDRVYFSDYNRYMRSLNQRNFLLREISFRPSLAEELPVWNEQLLTYGRRIMEKRALFLRYLQDTASEIHCRLTGGTEKLTLLYEPNAEPEAYEALLERALQNDLRQKTTTCGPHRDDFSIRSGDMDLRVYGSQGQQRTAALSLKLSQIRLIEERVGVKPILLLDDVLSELDRNRQNYLLESLVKMQTFITCTGLDEFVQNQFEADRIFQVKNGMLQ